jgi:hypothetical protein
MSDFPTGINKTVFRPDQINQIEWIENSDEFLERQNKHIANLEAKVESYKLFAGKDPSRSMIEERVEMLENMRKLYGKIMIEPPKEIMYKMPLLDLELEKLKNELIVIELLEEIRRPNGLFGEEIKNYLLDSPIGFVVEFENAGTDLYMDFVRGFVMTLMNEGKNMHTYIEVWKDDPGRARKMIQDTLKLLSEQNWIEMWPKIKNIGAMWTESYWTSLRESDGAYASFLAGKVCAFFAISALTGGMAGIAKLNKLAKYTGAAAISMKRQEVKYIATLSDGYDFLTNEKAHEDLLRLFHKKLPEVSVVNLREGLESMIRYVISLPPAEQSAAVEKMLEFVNSEDLKKLQENPHFNLWIEMWLQREESNEQISIGAEIWKKGQKNTRKVSDQKIIDEIAQDFFWNRYGVAEFQVDTVVSEMEGFKKDFFEVLEKDKTSIQEFTYENRDLVRKLILIETPFGWRVNFRNLMEGIVTKLQTHVGIGDLFSLEELPASFSVVYPDGYNGDDVLIAKTRKGRKYLNKDGKYLAIFDDCDIIIR